MSKFKILVTAALLAAGSAFAQDATQPAPPPAPATGTPQPKHTYGDRSEQKLKKLSKKLNLTDDQKEKIRPILQDQEKQFTSLKDDTTLTSQDRQKKMRAIRMASKAQMDEILTPEQKEEIQSAKANRHGRHMPAGKPNSSTTTPDTSDQQQQ